MKTWVRLLIFVMPFMVIASDTNISIPKQLPPMTKEKSSVQTPKNNCTKCASKTCTCIGESLSCIGFCICAWWNSGDGSYNRLR
jgi:hypothetical protein